MGRLRAVVRRRGARLLSRTEVRLPWSHAVLAPIQRRLFDGVAPVWDTIRDQSRVERLLDDALDFLDRPDPTHALDIGTGTGQAAFALARKFPTATIDAIDGSATMIEQARRKPNPGRVVFRTADAAALPFAARTFELVISLCVQPFAAETARVLTPDGLALYAYSSGPGTPIWFPPETLERVLRPHGLEAAGRGESAGGVWSAFRKRA